MKREVMGVKVDDLSKDEILGLINEWLSSIQKPIASRLVFTPGPEFLITSQKDQEFKNILNKADLAVNESFGLQLYCGFKNRVPGIDLMLSICKLAAQKKFTVGLLGGFSGVAKKTKEKLEVMYPGIKIVFASDGKEVDRLIRDCDTLRYVDILFVALGHPKQEKFLSHCKFQTSNCKFCVGMGVGGSFDLISGKFPRAPKIFQSFGLEWLWRGITKPNHFFRSLNAAIVFPIKYLLSKI